MEYIIARMKCRLVLHHFSSIDLAADTYRKHEMWHYTRLIVDRQQAALSAIHVQVIVIPPAVKSNQNERYPRSLHTSRSQIAHQRRLVPDHIRLLAFDPTAAVRAQFDIKSPEKSRQNCAHLVVRQAPPQTGAGTYEERLERAAGIVEEWRLRIFGCAFKPAFRMELVGFEEGVRGASGCKARDTDTHLQGCERDI